LAGHAQLHFAQRSVRVDLGHGGFGRGGERQRRPLDQFVAYRLLGYESAMQMIEARNERRRVRLRKAILDQDARNTREYEDISTGRASAAD
jgi:hypothetical protein